jgi:hypothetical protein
MELPVLSPLPVLEAFDVPVSCAVAGGCGGVGGGCGGVGGGDAVTLEIVLMSNGPSR